MTPHHINVTSFCCVDSVFVHNILDLGDRAVRSVRFNDTLAGAIDAEAVQATGDAYVALLHDLDELVNTDTAFQARSAPLPALFLACC